MTFFLEVTVKGSHLVMNQQVPFQRRNTVSNPEPVVREIMTKLVFLMKGWYSNLSADQLYNISSIGKILYAA